MLNGKLSALRWVIGDEWDMLDTLPKLADSPLEERGFELLVPSAISSWIGWVPNPCSGGFELLVPGTASWVAAPCHSNLRRPHQALSWRTPDEAYLGQSLAPTALAA